jgi:hypothetical protein
LIAIEIEGRRIFDRGGGRPPQLSIEVVDRETPVPYIRAMSANPINDVQPKAVMTPDEVARWNELPADEQLARLRVALQSGIDSGPADATMDQIWAKIRSRA